MSNYVIIHNKIKEFLDYEKDTITVIFPTRYFQFFSHYAKAASQPWHNVALAELRNKNSQLDPN